MAWYAHLLLAVMASDHHAHLNMVFVRRLRRLTGIMFLSASSAPTLLFIVLLGLNIAGVPADTAHGLLTPIAEQVAIYNSGLIPSRFYAVLVATPVEGSASVDSLTSVTHIRMDSLLWQSFLTISVLAMLMSLASYVVNVLEVMWRCNLTRHLHERYFRPLTCYNVAHILGHALDNP
jgi:ABC-type uncharacterized transport system fused permease/ATPase subunit